MIKELTIIEKVDELYRQHMSFYYQMQDENLKPNAVFVGHNEYVELLRIPEIDRRGRPVNYISIPRSEKDPIKVFGLPLIRVNEESFLAIGTITHWEGE